MKSDGARIDYSVDAQGTNNRSDLGRSDVGRHRNMMHSHAAPSQCGVMCLAGASIVVRDMSATNPISDGL